MPSQKICPCWYIQPYVMRRKRSLILQGIQSSRKWLSWPDNFCGKLQQTLRDLSAFFVIAPRLDTTCKAFDSSCLRFSSLLLGRRICMATVFTSIPKKVRQVDEPFSFESSRGTSNLALVETRTCFWSSACYLLSATKMKSSR